MEPIKLGVQIEVTDALGRSLRKRALSGVEDAGNFSVVWACSEEEWTTARTEDREPEPDPFPWPLDDLRVVSTEAVGV